MKMAQGDFEGNLYKQIYDLIEKNKEIIQEAKPHVAKNSAGYYLWNVVRHPMSNTEEIFDLNRLLVGSQGTLGILTEARLRLVPVKSHHDLIALFFKSWDELPAVVNAILPHQPESLETFDEETLKLGLRFMPEIAKRAGVGLLSFAAKFLPEAWIGVEMGGLPQLIVLVEIAEENEREVGEKREKILEALKPFALHHRVIEKDSEEAKFWIMRRESFNLLRQHSGGKKAAPFVDDFCVPTSVVPEFLPQVKAILEQHGIKANIAGHAGEGNFHIIPLMDLKEESERAKIIPVASEIYKLVAQYKGTTTGEHNDGIMRTPYLSYIYKPEILELFKQVKEIFDPENIFNPGKKVPATTSGQVGSLEYIDAHLDVS
jgi:FAD/FMN-containing dehydrogenase